MGAKAKVVVTLALAGTCGVLALPSVADAARSGVTIHLPFGDEFRGFVFSPKPLKCADYRTVKLFRQKGKQPNPKRDVKVGKTHALRRGSGKYRWIVDVHHARPGNYYARVPATPDCQADNSKASRISARPKTRIVDMSGAFGHVTFYYEAVGGVAPYRFHCRLDHQDFEPCTHVQKVYRHLRHGRHVFRVYASGHNGKGDRTPAKQVFHTPM